MHKNQRVRVIRETERRKGKKRWVLNPERARQELYNRGEALVQKKSRAGQARLRFNWRYSGLDGVALLSGVERRFLSQRDSFPTASLWALVMFVNQVRARNRRISLLQNSPPPNGQRGNLAKWSPPCCCLPLICPAILWAIAHVLLFSGRTMPVTLEVTPFRLWFTSCSRHRSLAS